MARLGIVTVLFRSNGVLEGFLKSLSIQDYKDYELYLVDNSPCDETDQLIAKLSMKWPVRKLTHIKSETNVGAAEGNNIGIRQAMKNNNEIILLTNTDIRFDDQQLLSKAIRLFDTSNETIVVPKIYTENKEKVWMAGAGFTYTLAKAKHYGYEKDDSPKYDVSRHVKYAPTTFMFLKKDIFNNVGLLDPKYFAYYEDADFIFRTNQKGYRIYYFPGIDVEHLASFTTGGTPSVFTMYHVQRNRIYFTRKNVPVYKWVISFPYFLLIGLLRTIRYTAAQRKATIKGMIDGFKLRIG